MEEIDQIRVKWLDPVDILDSQLRIFPDRQGGWVGLIGCQG